MRRKRWRRTRTRSRRKSSSRSSRSSSSRLNDKASLNKRSNNTLKADPSKPSLVWDQGRKTLHAALAGDTVTFEVATDAAAAKASAGALAVP